MPLLPKYIIVLPWNYLSHRIGSIFKPLDGKVFRRYPKGVKTMMPHDWLNLYMIEWDWLKGSTSLWPKVPFSLRMKPTIHVANTLHQIVSIVQASTIMNLKINVIDPSKGPTIGPPECCYSTIGCITGCEGPEKSPHSGKSDDRKSPTQRMGLFRLLCAL